MTALFCLLSVGKKVNCAPDHQISSPSPQDQLNEPIDMEQFEWIVGSFRSRNHSGFLLNPIRYRTSQPYDHSLAATIRTFPADTNTRGDYEPPTVGMRFAHKTYQCEGTTDTEARSRCRQRLPEERSLRLGFQGLASQDQLLKRTLSHKEEQTCRVETGPVREDWDP